MIIKKERIKIKDKYKGLQRNHNSVEVVLLVDDFD